MNPIAAIVEPALDIQQCARDIASAHIALQDCERQLDAAEKRMTGLRDEQRRRHVELGRLLIAAKRVVKHGGWEPFITKLGVTSQRASEWIRLAEFADSKSPTFGDAGDLPDAPTLADAGIDRRSRAESSTTSTGSMLAPVDELPVPISLEDDYQSDEWYTPVSIVELAREVLGEIDLDPATCEFAQTRINAARFYTEADNGLEQEWRGRVWMNPPYSHPLATRFADKLIAEYRAGRVTEAIVIQNAMPSSGWFQRLADLGTVCLPRKRIQFDRRDGRTDHHNNHSQVLFYIGPHPERFRAAFADLGLIGDLRSHVHARHGSGE